MPAKYKQTKAKYAGQTYSSVLIEIEEMFKERTWSTK